MGCSNQIMESIPKFVEGVWVGFLDDFGFVVFDPDIKNLFSYPVDGACICLWVKNKSGWAYFNIEDIRPKLEANLSKVTQFARELMANFYFAWKWKVEDKDEYSCYDSTTSYDEYDPLGDQHFNQKKLEDSMSDEDAYFNVLKGR